MFLCLLYTIAVAVSKEIEVTANFANDYFQAKGVRQIVSFGCWNTDGIVSYFTYKKISNTLMLLKFVHIIFLSLGEIFKILFFFKKMYS